MIDKRNLHAELAVLLRPTLPFAPRNQANHRPPQILDIQARWEIFTVVLKEAIPITGVQGT